MPVYDESFYGQHARANASVVCKDTNTIDFSFSNKASNDASFHLGVDVADVCCIGIDISIHKFSVHVTACANGGDPDIRYKRQKEQRRFRPRPYYGG